jgi:AcrR family transcriptional regulator
VGLEGLTIGKLADELGLSKSGLLAHYRSKENLQLDVIQTARQKFVDEVIAPALRAARGEPRVRALFEHWVKWAEQPGGCLFVAASAELDDSEGVVRDAVVGALRDLLDTLAHSARIAVEEKHFVAGLDVRQFATELHAIMLGCHLQVRLLRDPEALSRARRSFDALLERSRS